jgi:hypothetical protein
MVVWVVSRVGAPVDCEGLLTGSSFLGFFLGVLSSTQMVDTNVGVR